MKFVQVQRTHSLSVWERIQRCVLCAVGWFTHGFTSPRHESREALYRYFAFSKCLYWTSVHVTFCIKRRILRECTPRLRREATGSGSLSCSLTIESHLFYSSLYNGAFLRYVTWSIFVSSPCEVMNRLTNGPILNSIVSYFNAIIYWTFLGPSCAVAYRWTDQCPHYRFISLTKCKEHDDVESTQDLLQYYWSGTSLLCGSHSWSHVNFSLLPRGKGLDWQHSRVKKTVLQHKGTVVGFTRLFCSSASFSPLLCQFSSKDDDINIIISYITVTVTISGRLAQR
jgi:hypothetical protein